MSEQGPTVFGGRYELHRRLARGGMAEVFLARDQLLDRPVAVKVLFPEFATDPSFVERFRREAQAAANLNHPNIVGVYDWGREGSTYYIVMEYVPGRSLADIIRSDGPLPPARVAEIADEVAAALGFAHRNDFVHRDMKSSNVIITPNGQAKVADFGIATAISGGAQANLTQTGAVMGTATYFSPEQAQGRPLDGRSDLYSLGVVMYEMLTGTPPFRGDSPVAIAYQHVQEAPEPISARRPGVPEALTAITAKLLSKNPDARYPTAADLQADLRRFQAGAHTLAAASPSAAVPIAAPGGRSPYDQVGASPYPDPRAGVDATQINPRATGTVRAAAPPPVDDDYYYDDDYPPERPVWMWVAATVGVLAVIVVLIVVALNAFGGDGGGGGDEEDEGELVAVPELVDLTQDEAIAAIEDANLRIGEITTEETEDVDPDIVLEQNPAAGEEVEENTRIDLVVSIEPGGIEVPSVVGLTEDEARVALTQAGFERIEIEPIEDEADEGIVVEQVPEPDELWPAEEPVIIRVSEGPGEQQVPNLEGQARADAERILSEEPYEFLVQIEEVEDDDIAEGFVVGTRPSAGSMLPPGEPITLLVSSGPGIVRVPNVVGESPERAQQLLEDAGLTVRPDTGIITDPDNQVPGSVIDQRPAGGVDVEPGSEVTIIVGVEPEPTPTPEPTPVPPTPTPVPPTPTPVPPTPTPEP